MNRFLALILLVNLAFAHLPSTPASLRRSAAHKRRLDDAYLSPALALHRRDLIPGDGVTVLGQTPNGLIIALVNGVTTTLPASSPSSSPPPGTSTSSTPSGTSSSSTPPDTSSSSTSSDTSTSSTPSDTSTSSGTPTSTPSSPSPSPSSDSSPSSTPSSVPPSSTSSSGSSPTPSSSEPTSSSTDSCGLLGLGILCQPSSTPPPSSTSSSPSLSTSDSPNTSTTSDPPNTSTTSNPSQSSQPPSTTDTTSPTTTGALCSLLGIDCPASSTSTPTSTSTSTSVSSGSPSVSPSSQASQPPSTTDTPSPSSSGDLCSLLGIGCPSSSTPVTSDTVSTQPPPTSSGTVTTQPPSSSSSVDLCSLLGVGCPPSSTPISSDSASNPPSQTPSTSGTPLLTTSGDMCAMFGIGCTSSSTPLSSGTIPTQSPPASIGTLSTQPPSSSSSGDLCAISGIGCPPSSTLSTPLNSDLISTLSSMLSSEFPGSTQPSISTNIPSLTSLPPSSEPTGSTQFQSSDSLSTTRVSLPSGSSSYISSGISFPSESPSLSLSSTPDSVSTTPPTTLPPLPSNTQFGWLTQSSLIFSSFSQSTDSMSLTDPDQVPTTPTSSTTGTPTTAPSAVPLPSGIPARIVPGSGGVDPSVDNLNGYTLIAILFDQGLNWETVVQNPDSPGQIFAWLPTLIQTSLGVTPDQVKSFALQVWIPVTYLDPRDVALLGTTWLGYIPTTLVDTLASQIKVKTSPFYVDLSSPYSDLADHVDPSFDIMTVTTTTGIPGSGGSSTSSSGATSGDSRTRENAIIGVVSALGGITLIILGCLIYRAVQKRRELAHRRLSDPPTNPFIGEAPPNRNFDQDSIGGQRRRSFYFAEDSLRGFSDYSGTNDGTRLSPEQTSGLNRRPIAGNIGPPVMRENSLNF